MTTSTSSWRPLLSNSCSRACLTAGLPLAMHPVPPQSIMCIL